MSPGELERLTRKFVHQIHTEKDLGRTVAGTTFAIQGFGNVGSHTARLLYERGGKVLAVSDVSGGLFDPKGLDIPPLVEHARGRRLFKDHVGEERRISNEELLNQAVRIPHHPPWSGASECRRRSQRQLCNWRELLDARHRIWYFGGMVLGPCEALTSLYIGPPWAPSVAYTVLIVVLVVRPHGLFGVWRP
jgi:hypothetical protein